MQNKFFYNKLLPIISVFLLVIFILTSSVFGSDNTITFKKDGEVINLPCIDGIDLSNGFAINYFNGVYYLCYLTSSSGHFYLYAGGYSADCSFVEYKFANNSWSYSKTFSSETLPCPDDADFIYASVPIYTDSSCTEIFFHPTPLVTQVLVEETQKVQIANQLKIMIVGFLKYLIVLVISLIAFWKGWQFLLTQLRKA